MTKTLPHFNLIATLVACAVVFFAVGWYASPRGAPAANVPQIVAPATVAEKPATRVAPAPTSAPAPAPIDVAKLADNSMNGAMSSRLAAIDALARAPRAEALPALRRVLLNGDPWSDRPAALRGLETLAKTQGDADGGIRAAVREAIYHGDDESLTAAAQDTLDSIERFVR